MTIKNNFKRKLAYLEKYTDSGHKVERELLFSFHSFTSCSMWGIGVSAPWL